MYIIIHLSTSILIHLYVSFIFPILLSIYISTSTLITSSYYKYTSIFFYFVRCTSTTYYCELINTIILFLLHFTTCPLLSLPPTPQTTCHVQHVEHAATAGATVHEEPPQLAEVQELRRWFVWTLRCAAAIPGASSRDASARRRIDLQLGEDQQHPRASPPVSQSDCAHGTDDLPGCCHVWGLRGRWPAESEGV